jgi:hypothetical protein
MEKMTWSGGDTLRAVLLLGTLVLLLVPVGPESAREFRKNPPSQRKSAVRLALRVIGALGFLAVTAWYVSALHWSTWVVPFAVVAVGVTLSGSVARYALAKRLRAAARLGPASSGGGDEDRHHMAWPSPGDVVDVVVVGHARWGLQVRLRYDDQPAVVDVRAVSDDTAEMNANRFPPVGSTIRARVLGRTPLGELRLSTRASDLADP